MIQASNPAKFLQEEIQLGNQYLQDTPLIDVLHRILPINVLNDIEPDLVRWGDRVMGDVIKLGREAENNPPRLVQYNAYGRGINEVVVTRGWDDLKDISAEEGLVAIAFERKYGEWSRVYQFVKVLLFGPSSSTFDCPLSMTDGAVRLLELNADEDLKRRVIPHFITRDPKKFWTSGQWMTERPGGSDVGNTETIARKVHDKDVKISGYKFFTSASTSETSILLAREVDDNGATQKGSKGLSAYFVETRDKAGNLNGITVHKLKNKMGTKALPTAELELNDMVGERIGAKGNGIRVISSILNITRIHNAVGAVSAMRRVTAIARDYATRRYVFGRKLADTPLHLSVIADMEVEYRAALQFVMEVIQLMGLQEVNKSTPNQDTLLRILTPLLKLYTAKQAIAVASEGVESLGGLGYMEDSDVPRALRDAQVLSIWEGSTNVLSMDLWRPLSTNPLTISLFGESIESKIKDSPASLVDTNNIIRKRLREVKNFVEGVALKGDTPSLEASARRFSYFMARVYMGALLVHHATWSKQEVDEHVAKRWIAGVSSIGLGAGRLPQADEAWRRVDRMLALDIDAQGNPNTLKNAHKTQEKVSSPPLLAKY